MSQVWHTIEAIPGLKAVSLEWQRQAADQFTALKPFLNNTSERAASYPCSHGCGCSHAIISHADGSIVAVCQCDPCNCNDVRLTATDTTLFQLNTLKLGRSIARSIGCDPLNLPFHSPRTWQIGALHGRTVPVAFTIQHELRDFRQVISELTARWKSPFVLISPTARFFDGICKELLETVGAVFIDLETHFTLSPDANLQISTVGAGLVRRIDARHDPQLREAPATYHQALPRYMLRKGLGTWTLIFDGKEDVLKHEKGIFYVAYLLKNPPKEPMHAIDLAAQIPQMYRQQLGITAAVDQTTGKTVAVNKDARLVERSLGLDDMETARRLYAKQQELEAILDDDSATEPEKAEALRELEQLMEFQSKNARRSKSNAENIVRAVRRAITRFHEKLLEARGPGGTPHAVFAPFAEHLSKYLLTPSSRYSGCRASKARVSLAGSFTYEPPDSIKW